MKLIQWGDHPRQRVWTKILDPKCTHWLVIIHGGAWRDERITHESATVALKAIEKYQSDFRPSACFGGLASVDYRLSPEIVDPEHLSDIMNGIEQLNAGQVTLIGHSAGAFLAGQVAAARPNFVQAIVGIEGIFDLKLLVDEYPDYFEAFLADAFGRVKAKWPQLNWPAIPLKVIVHSLEDGLISFKQPEIVLRSTHAKLVKLKEGTHDQVYEEQDDWVLPTMRLLDH